jgi:hypothetical protein
MNIDALSSRGLLLMLVLVVGISVLVAISMYVTMKKAAGRTTRLFYSDKNVWAIVEQWTAEKDYSLVGQDENSRRYTKNGIYFNFIRPQVIMSRTSTGYQLEANLLMRANAVGSAFMALAPSEMALDKTTNWWWYYWRPYWRPFKYARVEDDPTLPYPLENAKNPASQWWWHYKHDQSRIARRDVNDLINKLDSGIEPIPYQPLPYRS